MKSLLKTTGFISFISMIFLNAFVDLGHKIIIQNTIFKIYDGSTQIILTAIVNGLILLPFILLFTPSGFLADRFKKPTIMRWSAMAAVVITLLITLSYYMGWFNFAFAMTFMLAVQSAFYSPSKYGYIREIAGKDNLALANSFVQSTTIIAILLGMFVFSIFFETHLSGHSFTSEQDIIEIIAPIGWLLVIGSLIELYFSFQLPPFRQQQSTKAFNWQHYRSGKSLNANLKLIRYDSVIWLSIIGLSVFWGVSQAVLATFPAYAKEVLAINNTIFVQGLLACSGFGIIGGSLLAGRISNHYIETALIPLGTLGMVISLAALPQVSSGYALVSSILAFGFFGGLFIVPLNSLIQFRSNPQKLGTVLAGNNWIQNVVMLGFLILTALFSLAGIHSQVLLYIVTVMTAIGAIYTVFKLPQSLIRYVVGLVFSTRYKINVQGFHNIPSQSGVLLLGNHISWLDWAIIQIASPRPIRFVMDKGIYERKYLKWFLDFFGVIPISRGASKESLIAVNNYLKAGEIVCLFPEGSISRNGQLAEFKKGFERSVEGVDGIILPFYIHGLWGSRFSRSSAGLRKIRHRPLRRDIIIAFGDSMDIISDARSVKHAVFELSINAWQHHIETLPALGRAWIKRAKKEGRADCLTDIQTNKTISRRGALTASLLFSRYFKSHHPTVNNIGFLLPTSCAGILANMACFISGKTAVNLNYTASAVSLMSAIRKADIKTVYTSSKFLQKLNKKGIDLSAALDNVEVIYLEDVHQQLGKVAQLVTFIATYCLPASLLQTFFGGNSTSEQNAVILFSSGSEGEPNGVILSHQNIMANIKQVSDVLDTQTDDVIVANLPLFHAFGLTVTSLMPLIEGIPTICHPDPTDVLTIAKGIKQHNASIFCGTSTFLRLFNKNNRIHPLMLDSLRIVVAGAERLKPQIRDEFTLKFGKIIYEGYGTTETAPVATVNIPDRLAVQGWKTQIGNKLGTVGLPLPGSSIRIVDPDSMEQLAALEDGLILVGGTQVMSGYLNDGAKTEQAIVELDGHRWYKTGDKGHLDKDGFLIIIDRYSRFAKIGGEMISLGSVESTINEVLPNDIEVMASTISDDKKGEAVALLYSGEIDIEQLKSSVRNSNLPTLAMPSHYIQLDSIPKLASGKNDFNKAKQIVVETLVTT